MKASIRRERAWYSYRDDDPVGPFVRFHRSAVDAARPQPCLRRHTFSGLSEKVCKKRRWMRIGLYRKPQKNPVEEHCASTRKSLCKAILQRRLRGTTLPSGIVATQGDGKTRCRGNNNASMHSPMVQNICVLLYMFVGIGPYRVQYMNKTGRVFRK